jgi:glyoxylase-like metal-dependent hydrolase (beta-lactamase superfamily II)
MAAVLTKEGLRATEVEDGIFQIWEPTGVSCFLIIGWREALLVDTGFGLGDLPRFVRGLTDLPVTVANTHGHVDHVGGNHRFGGAYLHPADFGLARRHMDSGERARVLEHFGISDPEYAAQGPSALLAISESQCFELGGRQVRTIACPGHTLGSVTFLDEATGIALVGDAISRHIWLFDEDSTTICDLVRSIRHLQSFKVVALYCSHSSERFAPGFMESLAGFAARIRLEDSKPFAVPLAGTEALIYHEGGALFESEDFLSIVYRREKLRSSDHAHEP